MMLPNGCDAYGDICSLGIDSVNEKRVGYIMCGRYSITGDLEKLQARFVFVAEGLQYRPRYNQAPGQDALVVLAAPEGRAGRMLHWGLVPHWAKDAKIGYKMINARAEGIAAKPAFREPFRRRRCLVPADGFYEWDQHAPKGKRQPWRFTLAGGEPFALAGLWEAWQAPGEEPESGRELTTFTIVTTRANDLVARLHERMPVILPPEAEAAWLDPDLSDPARLEPLLAPYSAEDMEAYPVSPLLNTPAHDGPELLQPARSEPGLFPGGPS